LSGEIPLSEYAMTSARFERFANRIHVESSTAVRASSDQAHHNHGTSVVHSFTQSLVIKLKQFLYKPGKALRLSKRLRLQNFKIVGT